MATSNPSVTTVAVQRALAGHGPDWRGLIFALLLLLSIVATLAILIFLLIDQLSRGLPVYQERGLDFLTSGLSLEPGERRHRPGDPRVDPHRDPRQPLLLPARDPDRGLHRGVRARTTG